MTLSTAKEMEKAIRDEVESLLQERNIYPLGSYGWSGPDDYDTEMIGHAMWQTDSLYGRFLDAHFVATHNNGPRPRMLEEWEQFLIGSGGDFEGLIEAARLSIGLVLLFKVTTERGHYDESSLFQVHLMSSMMLLSAAADRLRDLFIAGVFQANTKDYEESRRGKRRAKWYNAPFEEAGATLLGTVRCCDSLRRLTTQAKRMQMFRDERNDVVHIVATELGRQQKEFAKKQEPNRVARDISLEELRSYDQISEEDYRERVNRDVGRLVDWYVLLIEMSNDVFIVENGMRHLNSRPLV